MHSALVKWSFINLDERNSAVESPITNRVISFLENQPNCSNKPIKKDSNPLVYKFTVPGVLSSILLSGQMEGNDMVDLGEVA